MPGVRSIIDGSTPLHYAADAEELAIRAAAGDAAALDGLLS